MGIYFWWLTKFGLGLHDDDYFFNLKIGNGVSLDRKEGFKLAVINIICNTNIGTSYWMFAD